MIRPLTIATFLLAGGSGLYLYQSKHEVQLLDRTIERTVHDTGTLREQSRLLAAEWTMLNDPERLRQFSDTYLALHTISPAQFTSLADLSNRLPAPRAEDVSHPADDAEPVVVTPPVEVPPVAELPASDDPLPHQALPPTRPAVALTAVPHPADVRPLVSRPIALDRPAHQGAAGHEQRLADQRPPEQRAPEQRPPDQRTAPPRIAEVRSPAGAPPLQAASAPGRPPLPAAGPVSGPPPIVAYRQNVASAPYPSPAQPYPGSLLGAARGSMAPAPRPMPVNATYNAN